ncbi:hypothetical protein PspLS_07816 [Pyricularia sp. CBS 133598]|nr:hypothetical protein PspLS_07816 [Pyricularia sp. CBS 133598]
MSYPQDGRDMEDRPTTPGSVKRARERAMAGLPREAPGLPISPNAGLSRIPRPVQASRDGSSGPPTISRPTPVPQWPLAGPPASSISKPIYQPPPGRGPAPQRPPRPSPSHVPSMLDASKIQEHIPVFQYTPQTGRESEVSMQQSMASSQSRPTTLDSVGSIPDFPLPMTGGVTGPPRRSVTLGPPPSARRGASSFYSNASFVSPIPEESPRARSHTSYASSAAMPRESWASSASPGPSPTEYQDGAFDDRLQVGGRDAFNDEAGDESQLVRSASVGKRGKASLVNTSAVTRASEIPEGDERPAPSPLQGGPFGQGTGYRDSSSSGSLPRAKASVGMALTADSILNAYGAASSSDPSDAYSRRMSVSPQPPVYSHLSAIRRPPRLDVDGIRAAESRGSLTSLPDLIRRATRLAASLEKGRRPASRFDSFDATESYGYPNANIDSEKDASDDFEKHQSGLSDMLAAFPPPAQPSLPRRSFRQSVRDSVGQSWPLPARFSTSRSPPQQRAFDNDVNSFSEMNLNNTEKGTRSGKKEGRRCCGLPMWGFILLVLIILIIVTAAVVIPVEFFVIRRPQNNIPPGPPQSAIGQCQAQLTCANGGINIVTAQGTCSCICTNGFTGQTCTQLLTQSCTTTNIVDQNPNIGASQINNVTLGDAIPRIVAASQTTFGVPLSVSQILAKFNTGNLSCTAENALVTFNGQSTNPNGPPGGVANFGISDENPAVKVEVVTVFAKRQVQGFTTVLTGPTTFSTTLGVLPSILPTTTITITTTIRPTSPRPTTMTTPTTPPTTPSAPANTPQPSVPAVPAVPSNSFPVTNEAIDFARVAVLFILQQESLQTAEQAQGELQRFFTAASGRAGTPGVTIEQARNVTLLNGNSANLVDFAVDLGAGLVGRGARPTSGNAVVARDLNEVAMAHELRSLPACKKSLQPALMRLFRR